MDTSIDDPFPAGLIGFVWTTGQRLLLCDSSTGNFLLAAVNSGSVVFFGITGLMLVVLLFLSALISGSEVAFFSFSTTDIAECRKSQQPEDARILKMLENPKKLLATILILNNFVNIAFVTLSTFMTWRAVGSKTTEGLVVTTLTFLVTFAIVFFGEVVPKVYASQNNLKFARHTSGLLSWGETIFAPLA